MFVSVSIGFACIPIALPVMQVSATNELVDMGSVSHHSGRWSRAALIRGLLLGIPALIVGLCILIPSSITIHRLRAFNDKNASLKRIIAARTLYLGVLLLAVLGVLAAVTLAPLNSSFLGLLLGRAFFPELLAALLRFSLAFFHRPQSQSQESRSRSGSLRDTGIEELPQLQQHETTSVLSSNEDHAAL